MSDFKYIIIPYGAMFNFADVTEMEFVLEHSITFYVICPLAIVVQEIHREDCFNKRKQEKRMEQLYY